MGKQDLIVKQQAQLSSDAATPDAGYSSIYPKTDGKWYIRNSDGSIAEVTNVGGGGISIGLALAMSIFKQR